MNKPIPGPQRTYNVRGDQDFAHYYNDQGFMGWLDNDGVFHGLTTTNTFNFTPPVNSVNGGITGTFNGSNTTFFLPSVPQFPANLLLFLNGVLQIQGINYNISGATLNMGIPPESGDQLVAY